MRQGLEGKLVERWPTWFNVGGDIRQTLMPLGFQCGDGWFNILRRLCEDLEPLVADWERGTGCRFEVLEVKEKIGGLRFYPNNGNDAIFGQIEATEQESLRTCEDCGRPGRQHDGAWIRTLCDACAELGDAD